MLRGIAAAFAAVVLLAASPAPRSEAVSAGAQTELVRAYVDALKTRRFADAFALLDASAQAYFRTPDNFASGFNADGFILLSYTLAGSRASGDFRLFFVRETIRLHDAAHDTSGTTTVTVPYGVIGSDGAARIKDLGRPWRAQAVFAQHTTSGLTVTVRKISFYEHAIVIVVTFANAGTGYVTIMPYGRSVLRDNTGALYRPIVNTTFTQTDRRLFLGVHLAANEEISGVMTFASPPLDNAQRVFDLTVGPNVRDGAALPITVDVPQIGPPQ
jgi:hypothetical protein